MQKQLIAILWDEEVRLEGILRIENDKLVFQYQKPEKSELSLVIRKSQIASIEEYLLFGIERKGIQITLNDGRTDKFIVDSPRNVRIQLFAWLNS